MSNPIVNLSINRAEIMAAASAVVSGWNAELVLVEAAHAWRRMNGMTYAKMATEITIEPARLSRLDRGSAPRHAEVKLLIDWLQSKLPDETAPETNVRTAAEMSAAMWAGEITADMPVPNPDGADKTMVLADLHELLVLHSNEAQIGVVNLHSWIPGTILYVAARNDGALGLLEQVDTEPMPIVEGKVAWPLLKSRLDRIAALG